MNVVPASNVMWQYKAVWYGFLVRVRHWYIRTYTAVCSFLAFHGMTLCDVCVSGITMIVHLIPEHIVHSVKHNNLGPIVL